MGHIYGQMEPNRAKHGLNRLIRGRLGQTGEMGRNKVNWGKPVPTGPKKAIMGQMGETEPSGAKQGNSSQMGPILAKLCKTEP